MVRDFVRAAGSLRPRSRRLSHGRSVLPFASMRFSSFTDNRVIGPHAMRIIASPCRSTTRNATLLLKVPSPAWYSVSRRPSPSRRCSAWRVPPPLPGPTSRRSSLWRWPDRSCVSWATTDRRLPASRLGSESSGSRLSVGSRPPLEIEALLLVRPSRVIIAAITGAARSVPGRSGPPSSVSHRSRRRHPLWDGHRARYL